MPAAKKKAAKKAKRSVTTVLSVAVTVTTPDGNEHSGDIKILNTHACMPKPQQNNGEAIIEGFRQQLKTKYGRGFVE